MTDSVGAATAVAAPGEVLKGRPRPEPLHHLAAFAFPFVCLWGALWAGGGAGLAHAVLVLGSAHVVLVGSVWLELPRPKASVSNTMLGVALEPLRHVAGPLALFGVTTVVAAYVGAMVGETPDLVHSFGVVAWFLGAAALVVVVVGVPYVYWRAEALSGKHMRKARRRLGKHVDNPLKRSPAPIDRDAFSTRPVGEYALWLATSKGGRNVMMLALIAVAFLVWGKATGLAG